MIPGSSEDSQRISFFDEQVTHRARARRWSAVSALIVLALGGVYGFLMLGVLSFYAILLLGFLPKSLKDPLVTTGLTNNLPPAWFLLAAGMMLAAGIAIAIRRILGTASLGTIESALGLRPVNPADLEERQLANIVSEMAIAGGVPEPRLLLMEGDLINAGAAGKAPCTVFVSRRLLDHMDRDETQGVLGHLLASIANGDLRIASGVLTVLQTLGLFMTLMDLPFSARAREALARLARYALGAKDKDDAVEAHHVAARLTLSLQPEGMNDMLAFMERMLNLPLPLGAFNKVIGSLILMLFMPLILSRLAGFLIYSLLALFLLGPFIAFAIRARRRLADATAVQLTRNPNGLGRALVHLTRLAHPLPEIGWAEMLFIVGSETIDHRNLERISEHATAMRAQPNAALSSRVAATREMIHEIRKASPEESEPEKHGFIYRFHPSLNRRIVQLKRMGANVEWNDRREYSDLVDGILVGGFLLAIAIVLLFASQS
ncbi:MAG TPA: M48 family metalloprotease [Terrimicrobiaceae bacterium]